MTDHKNKTAYVCFSGDAEIWWLRILQKGFRHCFLIQEAKDHWLVIDPLSTHLDIEMIDKKLYADLPLRLKETGLTVMRTKIMDNEVKTVKTLGVLSCVNIVKRILGVHKFSIITPAQLARFLEKGSS